MSIYIPGIAPPENCDKCTHPTCTLWQNHEPDGRHKDCPIIELPPHGRLIDADALKIYQMEENVRAYGEPNEYEYDAGLIDGLHMAAKDVSAAPTVIPADPEGGADNA